MLSLFKNLIRNYQNQEIENIILKKQVEVNDLHNTKGSTIDLNKLLKDNFNEILALKMEN